MPADKNVFALYTTSTDAERGVDGLIGAGFPAESISVLHQENRHSREFAERKQTRAPEGTEGGTNASLPLGGTTGFWDPGAGPEAGALPKALAAMGVPAEWCGGRVLKGKVLVSVECEASRQSDAAKAILAATGAEDIDSATSPEPAKALTRSAMAEPAPSDAGDIGSRNRPILP